MGTALDVSPEGAALSKTLADLNPPLPVTLDSEDSVEEAVNFMLLKQMGCVLVTSGEQLAGILTERDILSKVVGQKTDLASLKISEVMTPAPDAFRETDTVAAVIKKMSAGGYRHAPIVDARNTPTGILSIRDILGVIAQSLP